jgi:hypothetical protein
MSSSPRALTPASFSPETASRRMELRPRDSDAAIGEDRPPDGVSDIPLRSGRVVLKGTEIVGPSC